MQITYFRDGIRTQIVQTLHGELDAQFETFHNLNDRLRYCNGCYWKFNSAEDERAYFDWQKGLSFERSFSLHYRGGVVD